MNTLAVQSMPITEAIAEMLRPFSVKAIARKLNASPRTVENWREGRTAPQAKHMVAMLADDELCERLLRMAGKGDLAHAEETITALRKALGKVEGQ